MCGGTSGRARIGVLWFSLQGQIGRPEPSDWPLGNFVDVTPRERSQLTRQARVLSTVDSVPNSSSICAREMIKGGDSAIVSPVVLISTPFSKASRNAGKARFVGASGTG